MTDPEPRRLTRRERDVLAVLAASRFVGGPTEHEIAARIGTSRGHVKRMLDRLGEEGFVKRDRRKARSIRLVRAHDISLPPDIFRAVAVGARHCGLTMAQYIRFAVNTEREVREDAVEQTSTSKDL